MFTLYYVDGSKLNFTDLADARQAAGWAKLDMVLLTPGRDGQRIEIMKPDRFTKWADDALDDGGPIDLD